MQLRHTYTNLKAIAWVTIGTALFSLIFASGKFVAGWSVSPLQILFLRYAGGLATLLSVVAARREHLSNYRSKKPFSHLWRAIFGASGGGAIIYASANMPIVDATAISLLYVVFVILLGVLFMRDRLTVQHIGAVAICCAGASIIMASRGAFTAFRLAYVFPACIAILGAALMAVEGLMIKMLSRFDRAMTVLLYVNMFGILLMAIPAFIQWRSLQFETEMLFALLGPIAVTAQYCIVQGYRLASLSIVGPIDYTWLIFAGVIGFLFFGEKPTLGVALGSAIIAIGGITLAITKPVASERDSKSPA
ncbi:membrane protein [Candidatus Burkholderia verschuerenii]|uniref:Membrane protein n=1 Tax=Candidatus Burkholderia verschuerenii TaxID=242163 RepID=A0A0L0M5T3_9BURK|nr:DMT family transporter [Candidatus Burkholderia verschuerenii]KND57354.1 membrane protein [Candidatus Burkholderia verschuerenii]